MFLKGKTAIVTGASRGIGRSIALHLAQEGCNLVLTATNKEKLKQTENEVKKKGADAIHVAGDIRKSEDVKRIVKEALKQFGKIDIVINNAGVAVRKKLEKTSEKEYDWIMDVNLKGIFLMCKEVVPLMKKQGGVIVNISSGAGQHGIPTLAVYCASKFAVIGLTEALAAENDNIKVYAVCPGSVDTDMYHSLFPGRPASLDPEDVAKKVMEAVRGLHRSGSHINVRK